MRHALLLCASVLFAACEADDPEVARAKPETIDVALDVDIRNHADLHLAKRGDELEAKLTVDASFGVLPAGQPVSGRGRVEHFPEADLDLYTARFALSAVTEGPCKDQPLSLALALQRRAGAARYSGSLTAYCGKDVWAGLPARQPLRLATPTGTPE